MLIINANYFVAKEKLMGIRIVKYIENRAINSPEYLLTVKKDDGKVRL